MALDSDHLRESASAALSGWTVVTLRPAMDARGLLSRLRRAGANAFNLPLLAMRTIPSDQVVQTLREAWTAERWLFSSPTAVRSLQIAARGLSLAPFAVGGPIRQRAAQDRVYAPGPGTARALVRHGVHAVRVPSARFDSEGLLELPDLASPLEGTLVLVGADGGRGLLPTVLAERGARVLRLNVYQREARPLSHHATLRLAGIECPMLVVSSEAMLREFVSAAPSELRNRLASHAPIVVASQRLSDVAATLDFRHRHVAGSARPADLTDACIAVARLMNHRFG